MSKLIRVFESACPLQANVTQEERDKLEMYFVVGAWAVRGRVAKIGAIEDEAAQDAEWDVLDAELEEIIRKHFPAVGQKLN